MHHLKNHYTVPEFAKARGVSNETIYKAIRTGRIVPDYVGKKKIPMIDLTTNIDFKPPSKL